MVGDGMLLGGRRGVRALQYDIGLRVWASFRIGVKGRFKELILGGGKMPSMCLLIQQIGSVLVFSLLQLGRKSSIVLSL